MIKKELKHNPNTCPQCRSEQINGWFDDMSDWASSKIMEVSGWADELLTTIQDSSSQYYQDAIDIYNQGQDAVLAKLNEAKNWVEKLKEKQKEVDVIIANTSDPIEKQKLEEKRSDSRGIFTKFVLPLFEKMTKEEKKAKEKYPSMGALPLIPLAAGVSLISVSLAVIYYTKKAYELEQEIMNDSSLSTQEKTRLLKELRETGNIQSIAKSVEAIKWPLMIGGVGFILYSVLGSRK